MPCIRMDGSFKAPLRSSPPAPSGTGSLITSSFCFVLFPVKVDTDGFIRNLKRQFLQSTMAPQLRLITVPVGSDECSDFCKLRELGQAAAVEQPLTRVAAVMLLGMCGDLHDRLRDSSCFYVFASSAALR